MRSYGRLFTNGHCDGRRSTRRISPRVLLAGIFVLALSLGACSNDQRPMDEPTTQLELQDASMPEVVFEGESATISAWGQQNSAAFSRLEAEVVSWPSNVPGKIEIRAIGETDTDMNGVDFQGQVQLPPLRAGDYDVHLTGSDTVRTLTVLPGQGWVRYRSFDDPMRPDVALLIEADGMAIAHRTDGGHAVRTVLSEEQRAAVRSWFEQAAFFDLGEMYLSDHPVRMRRVDIQLMNDLGHHRVAAQDDLMPPALAELVARLDRLVGAILESGTDRAPVIARLEADPVEGDPGSARALTLTLTNVTDQAVTLHFNTSQKYDITLFGTGRDGNGMPGDGDSDHDGGPMHDDDPNLPPEVMLWNWAHGRGFTDALEELTLRPGASEIFHERWPGLDNQGNVVPPGVYVLKATIMSTDPRVSPAVTRMIVRGRVPDRMSLVGTLSVNPATAPPGTERHIELAITNLNEVDLSSTFPTTQRFDLALVGRTGLGNGTDLPPDGDTDIRGLIWKWSEGQAFDQVEENVTWAAGTTRVYEATWNGFGRDNQPLGAGVYELTGWITGRPGAAVRPVTVVVSRQ